MDFATQKLVPQNGGPLVKRPTDLAADAAGQIVVHGETSIVNLSKFRFWQELSCGRGWQTGERQKNERGHGGNGPGGCWKGLER
jgi:hypothetical protein